MDTDPNPSWLCLVPLCLHHYLSTKVIVIRPISRGIHGPGKVRLKAS